jgi:acetyl-CoA C-acetyltransferase
LPRVAIVSQNTAKFTERSKLSVFELACVPCISILQETETPRQKIDAVLLAGCSTQQYGSNIISEMLGLRPNLSHRIESLCNSGTNAVVAGYSYIKSGLCDCVLIVGAENSSTPGRRLDWDISRGAFTFPVFWAAMFAKSHMRKYGTTEEQLAKVCVNNRRKAKENPNSLFSTEVTVRDVMESKKVVEPLKLLDCSRICDGASAILLVSEDKAKEFTDIPVWLKGIGQHSIGASFNEASKITTSAARIAASIAYRRSGIRPKDVDIAELHDAFTILEILAYEDLGFVKRGKGGEFVDQVEKSINTRGGILGCGHPIGATGIAQLVEIATQLAGRAGKRQVKGCKTGLVHNLAAAGTSATVLIVDTD